MKKKIIEPEAVKIEPLRQARFYGTPGMEPIGYRCGDIEIMRKLGETLDELRSRCRDSVEWPDAGTVHVFTPIRNK
jgi:hypothetical protein